MEEATKDDSVKEATKDDSVTVATKDDGVKVVIESSDLDAGSPEIRVRVIELEIGGQI